MASKYTIYTGDFVCHNCKAIVKSARFYQESKDLTWLCRDGHLSRVSFDTKKKKKSDYE